MRQRTARMTSACMSASTFCISLALSGCERIAQNMYDQPRDKPYGANSFFENGMSSREPLAGAIAYSRGAAADASSGRRGHAREEAQNEAGRAQAIPYPVTEELLLRGQDRYAVYCLPCHSPVGDGDGRVVRRGFPAPPSYHIDRLRDAEDRHFYEVITNGYGVMHAYRDRLEPPDRWAVVAYIRALQRSQHAALESLPDALKARALQGLESAGGKGTHP